MKILVLDTVILAAGELTETEAEITSDDAIYPKHVIANYQIIDTELPADYAPGRYRWEGEFVRLPDPAAPETFVPLTPRQIRLALNQLGHRQAVETAVAAGDQDLKDWWEFSLQYERTHALVEDMANGLGMAPEQVDALWRLGATL